MKNSRILLFLAAMFFFNPLGFSQEVDITKGELSFLKGETSINIEFTYEKTRVGDFSKEEDYIKSKKNEMNIKEPGSGDTWATKWEEDKLQRFPPKFILGFTNISGMTTAKDAKYTLIFNTKMIEPGYQVGVSKRNAGIDGTIMIVETNDHSKILAKLVVEHPEENMWRGAAFDAGSRIADAYYLSGQKVAKFIKKNMKSS